MHKTAVLNIVGLSPGLISAEHTPRLHAFAAAHGQATIGSVLPAVTTTVQSTYLTGLWPREHGIVGNGWYFRETAEVRFWLQSNKLVAGEKVWEQARRRDSAFTCANLFWWYNMYSSADYSVTPRPMYPADGRKIPDVYAQPEALRADLQEQLGQFPLFKFWGPATSIESSQWIAHAAMEVDRRFNPTLTLVYLPHLDYSLQAAGSVMAPFSREPEAGTSGRETSLKVAADLRAIDRVAGELIDHFAARDARVMILSEYGITPVARPVHINRVLRQHGLLAVREELGRELLDPGASKAFAVADHQVAHVHVNDRSRMEEVKQLLAATRGIDRVLDEDGKREHHLDHSRSGEFVCLADANAWFTYYYWLHDAQAPDFARTVDIHRKPGYDPVELFINPQLAAPKLRIAWALAKRKLGFRTLLNVIPLDAGLVKGSHGLPAPAPEQGPVLMSSVPGLVPQPHLAPTEIAPLILRHVFD